MYLSFITHKRLDILNLLCICKNARQYILTLILLGFLFISSIAQNQPVEVQRSKDKVQLEGKVYFLHYVKQGESLYGIARAYEVTIPEIIAINPAVANELKPNMMLRIPDNGKPSTKPEVHPAENEFIEHIVEPGQTMYAISKMYNLSVADIQQSNPDVRFDSMKIKQVLKIPTHPITKQASANDKHSGNFILHKVEQQETLYSLSKRYNVDQNAILSANVNLSNTGLRIGDTIKLPVQPQVNVPASYNITNEVTSFKQPPVVTKSLESSSSLLSTHQCDSIATLTTDKTVHITLLLPFYSNPTVAVAQSDQDENSVEKTLNNQASEFNSITSNFLELYQGALLACENLKKADIHVELNVYDTEEKPTMIDSFIQSSEFSKQQLIIGPVFPEQVPKVVKAASEKKVHVVSFNSGQDLNSVNTQYLIRINPSIGEEEAALAEYIVKQPIKRIVFVSSGNIQQQVKDTFINVVKSKIGTSKDFIFHELTVFDNDFSGLKDLLDSLENNLVVSNVRDEIFVNQLLRSMNALLILRPIEAMGMKEWAGYASIEQEYFYNVQFRYLCSFYSDFNTEASKNFIKNYRLLFGSDPVRQSNYGFNYALLGYDLVFGFGKSFANYGPNALSCIHCLENQLLSGRIHLISNGTNSGYINQPQLLIHFKRDFTIERNEFIK